MRSVMKTLLIVACAFVGDFVAPGPPSELHAAVEDLRLHVLPEEQPYTRYLSLYNIPVEQRGAATDVTSFVLNSVSRTAPLTRPIVVNGTQGRLLRISLRPYGLPADPWESAASRDPYWHLRTRVLNANHSSKSSPPVTTDVYTDGGWLDLHAAATLRQQTHSGGALLRADHFLTLATTTLDEGLYYELAGIPGNEGAFLKQLGIDLDTIDKLHADEGANMLFSRVTFKVRRIVRRQGPLGGVWQTYDVKASTPERDPLRNPFAFVFDAGEYIVAKKNGLHLYALFDNQGARQDSVPDVIAKDTSDPKGSGIVVPMISCVRCHVEDGLRPVANDQRQLVREPLEARFERPDHAERFAAFYLTHLEKRLQRDRDDYAEAVAQCTGGRTTREIASLLGQMIAAYADQPVTTTVAAVELGVSELQLRHALRGSYDPVLLALTQGIAVQRQQWEASFGEAALLVAPMRTPSPK